MSRPPGGLYKTYRRALRMAGAIFPFAPQALGRHVLAHFSLRVLARVERVLLAGNFAQSSNGAAAHATATAQRRTTSGSLSWRNKMRSRASDSRSRILAWEDSTSASVRSSQVSPRRLFLARRPAFPGASGAPGRLRVQVDRSEIRKSGVCARRARFALWRGGLPRVTMKPNASNSVEFGEPGQHATSYSKSSGDRGRPAGGLSGGQCRDWISANRRALQPIAVGDPHPESRELHSPGCCKR